MHSLLNHSFLFPAFKAGNGGNSRPSCEIRSHSRPSRSRPSLRRKIETFGFDTGNQDQNSLQFLEGSLKIPFGGACGGLNENSSLYSMNFTVPKNFPPFPAFLRDWIPFPAFTFPAFPEGRRKLCFLCRELFQQRNNIQ